MLPRKNIEVTPPGRDALVEVGRALREAEDGMLADLTGKERATLRELLRRVVAGRVADARAQGSCV